MRRIFLSLGFVKKPVLEVMYDISKAQEMITPHYKDKSIEFIHNYDYTATNKIECLGEAIKNMSSCDIVYFINDWSDHDECIVQKKVCELYNIEHKIINV